MDEIASPPYETEMAEETATIEDSALAPASETLVSEEPASSIAGEEEPFEEFVIEDFTIDGICGVY
jgi:mycofactocin precursor